MKNKLTFKQVFTAGLYTACAVTLINTIIYFMAHASGIFRDDILIKPYTPLTVVPVVIFSIISPLIGVMVFFLFEKYSQKGFRNFTIFGTIVFILMLVPPFNIKDVSLNYALILELMHLVTFALLLYFISRAKKTL